jgi:hypothetical protein
MEQFLTTFLSSLGIFFALGTGIYLKQTGKLPDNTENVLSFVLFKIVVPFLLFDVLYGVTFSNKDIPVVLAVLVLDIILIALAYVIAYFFNLSKKTTAALVISMIGFSVGVVAYPFTQLNFDNSVFQSVVVVDILLLIVLFFGGPLFGSIYNSEKDLNIKSVLKQIFTDATLLVVFLTIIISQLQIKIPEFATDVAAYFGSSYAFLVVLYTGMTIDIPNLKEVAQFSAIYALRLIVVLAVLAVTLNLADLSDPVSIALPLAFIAPFTSFGLYYTEKYNLDSKFVASLSVISILISFLIYPVVISFLR